MASSASSASSSSGKSLAVLIKKAMAKMPMSYNTKKSIDEYYKTAMKAINDKKKAEEKAKKAALKAALKAKEKAVAKPKAVKGSKTAKKPRAKKLVGGGMTKQEELDIIDSIIMKFIDYNNMLVDWQQEYKEGGYIDDIKELVRLINLIGYNETNIDISNENIQKSLQDDYDMNEIYTAIDEKVVFLIQNIIHNEHRETYDYYTKLYNSKKTP